MVIESLARNRVTKKRVSYQPRGETISDLYVDFWTRWSLTQAELVSWRLAKSPKGMENSGPRPLKMVQKAAIWCTLRGPGRHLGLIFEGSFSRWYRKSLGHCLAVFSG